MRSMIRGTGIACVVLLSVCVEAVAAETNKWQAPAPSDGGADSVYEFLPATRCVGKVQLGSINGVGLSQDCRSMCDLVSKCVAFAFSSAENACSLAGGCDEEISSASHYSGVKRGARKKRESKEESAREELKDDDDVLDLDSEGVDEMIQAANNKTTNSSYTYLPSTGCDETTLYRIENVWGVVRCEDLCSKKPGCGAFTYDPSLRRCYLKWHCRRQVTGKKNNLSGFRKGYGPAIISGDGNDASEYSYFPSRGCEDFTMQRLDDVMEYLKCQELCDAKYGCKAFTYAADSKRCYLKEGCLSRKTKGTNFSGARNGAGDSDSDGEISGSSELLDNNVGKRKFDTGSNVLRRKSRTDVLEMDVPKFSFMAMTGCDDASTKRLTKIGSSETCKAICSSEEDCRAFTFDPRISHCYLKKSCKAKKNSSHNFSGMKSNDKQNVAKFDIMEEISCTGNNFEHISMEDPSIEACAMMCATVDWCRSFNLNTFKKLCYLKRWGGDIEPSLDNHCGVLVDDGGDAVPVQMKLELDFWDRSSRSCNGRDQIEEVPSVMETPYDGKLYKPPGGGGIHSLLRPKSYTEKWHNHASHMVILPSGTILMAWFWGEEGEDGVAIVTSRLEQDATCWTDLQKISVQPGRSAQNPVLIYDEKKDETVLLHTSQAANKGQGTSEVLMLTSKNEGKTWSDNPTVIMREKGVFVRNTPLRSIENPDEWILPMYYTPDGFSASLTQYGAVKFSSDPATTWSEPSAISKVGMRLAQPSITRLKNGNILAILRDRAAKIAHRSVSKDEGRTWTEPKPIDVPNNNKAVTVLTLDSGAVLLMFTNSLDKNEKYPMSIAVSTDNGFTFPYVRDLQDEFDIFRNSEFSYGAMVWSPAPCDRRYATNEDGEDEDMPSTGSLHLSYTYSLKRRRTGIRYLCIEDPEAWVKSGPPSSGAYKGAPWATGGSASS